MTDLEKYEEAVARAMKNPVAYMQTDLDIDWTDLPRSLWEGTANWFCFSIRGDSFLNAVIVGDLYDAMGNADDFNRHQLHSTCSWFYSHFPFTAYRGNARSWGEMGGHFGNWKARLEDADTEMLAVGDRS